MLGSVTQAEDLVQDAFVAAQQHGIHNEGSPVRNLKSYLCRIVTNRCLDDLKSARRQRETYIGPWLPEPLVHGYAAGPDSAAAAGGDPLQTVILEDTISYAFLIMLDRLTPIERAVFILREAFEYDYQEIAAFVNKTELGCRKIYSRLKRKIQADSPVEPMASAQSEPLVLQFLQATATGDMEGLFAMLSEDIVLYSDGGGKANAATNPISTRKRVLAFIQGLAAKGNGVGEVRVVRVNGQLGFLLTSPADSYPTVVSLEFKDGLVQHIYLVRNPDKLRHLRLG